MTVDIEVADQVRTGDDPGFRQNIGSACSGSIPGTTCISGVWTLGRLAAGEETTIDLSTKLASGLPCCTNIGTNWTVPGRAAIKNTFPVEEERFKHNNADVGWISIDQVSNRSRATGTYWLEASVDDHLPEDGDTVKFSFKATMAYETTARDSSLYGVKLRLKLSPGMGTATATPPSGTTFAAASGLTRTWDWDIGTFQSNTALDLVVSTTLDDPLPSGVARSDLCLTAELTAERPPNLDERVTSAEFCFREDPVVLLQEGEAILWNMYPCVDVTAYPCSSDDTLEMRVVGGSAARAAGIARDEAVLDPDRVFIQVKDPEARLIDTQSHSVNSGTAPSWQTAREPDSRSGNRTVGGVEISYTRREFTSTQIDNYSNLARTMAVTGLDGGTAPGIVKVRFPGSGSAFYDLTTGTVTKPTFGLNTVSTTVIPYFAEFSTLGTYKIDFTAAVTHTDTTNHPNPYSGTGSYIFHVGPVAEMEVRDAGPNTGVASTQRAFTIVAVNNGPDDAPAVQVTVTNLNDSDYVSHTATKGTFATSTGIWTIGELREPDYQQGIYGRDGEVLTIITSAAVDTEITAAITNTLDYQVCIDSSGTDVDLTSPSETACTNASSTNTWHTTEYYDHVPGNSTTTIKAKAGTGADLPALQSPRAATTSIIVTWDAETEVNGRKVTHYEVQRETNPWVTVADDVTGTRYVDTDVNAGDTFQYRVRAVNDWDQKGPWSMPMQGTVPEPETPEPEVITNTETVYRDRVVTVTETVSAAETAFARFASAETSRRVAENSAPGTPVGAPVAVERNSGNTIAYSLEGADAALFEIERDSGQILVGHGTLLDYESDRIRYVVEVVAEPRLSSTVRTTVHIRVVDVAESATVSISPAGQPQMGQALTATLTHGGGEPVDPRWQWHRSAGDGLWSGIQGATSTAYTPTERDAGRRLRAIVTYGEPDGSGDGVAGAITPALPGDPATGPAARYDANGDGRIDLDEVIAAIRDYYAGDLDFVGVMEVIGVYYAG